MSNGAKIAMLKLPLDLLGPVNALLDAHLTLLGVAVQLRGVDLPANAGACQAIAEAAAAQVGAIVAEAEKRARPETVPR